MSGLVKDDLGNVRSGWVLLTFGAVAGFLYLVLMTGISLAGFYPRPPLTLDDWHLALTSSAVLISAGVATVVCKRAFGAPAGLGAPIGRPFALGALLGAGSIALSTIAPVLVGSAHGSLGQSSAGATLVAALLQLACIGPTSVGEELLLRGTALKQLTRGTNQYVAVAATGSLFGVLHLGNPSASLIASLNIALVGIWFGAVVVRTGSLWASIGMHVAWNWFEGFVFGVPVSGVQPGTSLFVFTSPPGPFWGGGSFGPEASGLTSVVLLIATVATVFWPRRATETQGSSAQSPGTAG